MLITIPIPRLNTPDVKAKKIEFKRNTHPWTPGLQGQDSRPWSMVGVVSLMREAEDEEKPKEKKKDELRTGRLSDSHILMSALVLHHL